MAEKKAKKEKSFEDKLWDTAEKLRGKVSPTAYKDIALGLLFLKFISYGYDQRREGRNWKSRSAATRLKKSETTCST